MWFLLHAYTWCLLLHKVAYTSITYYKLLSNGMLRRFGARDDERPWIKCESRGPPDMDWWPGAKKEEMREAPIHSV